MHWGRAGGAILLLLLCLPAGAETVFIRFHTSPPGAIVSLNGNTNVLGRADGSPLQVELGSAPVCTFELAMEGYDTAQIPIPTDRLRLLKELPEGGKPLALSPNTLASWAASNRALLGLLGLVTLAGTVSVAFLLARTRRARKLESLVATSEPSSLSGRKLGGYRLLEQLGRGGMARVYRALPDNDLRAESAVAIKLMQTELVEDPDLRQRFHREARMCMQLNHPGVVRVYDAGEQDGMAYLVLELLSGGTLRQRIQPGGLPLAEVARLVDEIFHAVAYAHSCGVVHRDLKPENIMLTAGDHTKLMDFGLGKKNDSTNLTQSGAILGTPAYMAPEQIQGADFEQGTDQYALGVILFELLTGRQPFESEDAVQLIFQHVSQDPPAPSTLRPELSGPIDAAVLRMLAKVPEHRFATVEEARLALLEVLR